MGLYIPQTPSWLTFSIIGFVVVASIWRGGLEERVVAAVLAWQGGNDLSPSLAWSQGLPTDVGTLGICLALALRSRRYWTIWAAASAVLSLATDALELAIGLTRRAYLSAQVAWSGVLVGSLFVGVMTHRRGEA